MKIIEITIPNANEIQHGTIYGDIRRLQATSFNNYNEDQRDKFKYNKNTFT